MQFDLGEGPCWDAVRSGHPVLEPHFSVRSSTRWPALSAAIRDDHLRSIFAFPLAVGPLRIGAVDLYSVEPVDLDQTQAKQADTMAGVIGRHVLRQALNAVGRDYDYRGNAYSRRIVHQATGMVLAQLDLSADDALTRHPGPRVRHLASHDGGRAGRHRGPPQLLERGRRDRGLGMSEITKEARLLQTFASLADTLVDGYDVVDLLQLLVDTCQELLDTTAAAILLAGPNGELDVVASTSEASRLVELIQISAEAGPCVQSYRTGEVVSVSDITQVPEAWAASGRAHSSRPAAAARR